VWAEEHGIPVPAATNDEGADQHRASRAGRWVSQHAFRWWYEIAREVESELDQVRSDRVDRLRHKRVGRLQPWRTNKRTLNAHGFGKFKGTVRYLRDRHNKVISDPAVRAQMFQATRPKWT